MTESGRITVHARDWFEGQKARYERVAQAVVRELIQNACDAILRAPDPGDSTIRVRIRGGRVVVSDPGIGFDADSLQHLAVVRASGTREVRAATRGQRADGFDVEGQFGVGFYATAMCADRVVVRTRSRVRPEAWEWTFLPEDFSFQRVALAPESRPFGTEVEVHVVQEWQRQFLDAPRLAQLVREVCAFVPFPIVLDDDAKPINSMQPPWDGPAASSATCTTFLRERGLLQDDDEVLFLAHLPWRADVGLSGVLYVPKWSSTAPAIDLHVNRYAIARSSDLLPPSLPFLHGVVIARDVDVNESRERVTINDRVRRLHEQLEAWALTGDPTWHAGLAAEPVGGLAFALRHPTPTTADFVFAHRRQIQRAATTSRNARCALGLDLPLPMLYGGDRTLRQLRPPDATTPVAVLTDPAHKARATADARDHQRSVVDGTTKAVEAFLRAASGEWGFALRTETGDEAATSATAEWQEALDLLRRRDRFVAEATCAALGRTPAVTLDIAALRSRPEFRLLEANGGDWQDVLRFLSVPSASVADDSRRTWLELMESVWQARWLLVLNTDHPLAGTLRRTASRRPEHAAALADLLLFMALRDVGVAWSPDLQRQITSELEDAAGRLCGDAPPDTRIEP